MCKMVEELAREREEKALLKGETKGKIETVKNMLKKRSLLILLRSVPKWIGKPTKSTRNSHNRPLQNSPAH